MKKSDFKIDPNQEFPHLKNAPIVEAALEIRTIPEFEWDEKKTRVMIEQNIKEYPNIQIQKESLTQLHPPNPPKPIYSDRWRGYLCKSSDNLNILQVNIESFVFSRIKPYENWERFFSEALKLWGIYKEYAKVKSIRRLGLRFINKISVHNTNSINIDDYLTYPPHTPDNMDMLFTEFLHRDSLAAPNYPYNVTIIRALKANPKINGADIIIDIDVFDLSLENSSEISIELLKTKFSEMRWLKNEIFFKTLKKEKWESMK